MSPTSTRIYSICMIITTFAFSGCCGPVREIYPPASDATDAHDVFIVNNHWHTGFVLAYADLSPPMKRLLKSFEKERFVEIGWGDDQFYPAPEGTSGLALHAMFVSRGTVLHVAGFDEIDPKTHYANYEVELYRIRVSAIGYARVMSFLANTFAEDPEHKGESIEMRQGLYGFSRFYRARGTYGAFHTCNNWTADGVRTTGFPISPFYAQTANNVGWQMKHFGRAYERDIALLDQ